MTGVFISFQVTVNALKVLLQYIESDEFKVVRLDFLGGIPPKFEH